VSIIFAVDDSWVEDVVDVFISAAGAIISEISSPD